MSVEIGQPAPDFTLKAHTGDEVTLSNFKGQQPVTLVFVPFAFTGVCTGELCAIRDDFTPFAAAGTEVLVITTDPSPSQKQWAEEQGYTVPLLSDFWPHGAVAKLYGAFNEERGCANRKTVVISKDGVVVDAFQSENLGTARTTDRYQEAMAKL